MGAIANIKRWLIARSRRRSASVLGALRHLAFRSHAFTDDPVAVVKDVSIQPYTHVETFIKLVRAPDRFIIIWRQDVASVPEPFVRSNTSSRYHVISRPHGSALVRVSFRAFTSRYHCLAAEHCHCQTILECREGVRELWRLSGGSGSGVGETASGVDVELTDSGQ